LILIDSLDDSPNSREMADTKETLQHLEQNPSIVKGGASAEDVELQAALKNYVPGTDAEKALVRKIDMRLIPMLWIMYVLNYIDRTNIVSL